MLSSMLTAVFKRSYVFLKKNHLNGGLEQQKPSVAGFLRSGDSSYLNRCCIVSVEKVACLSFQPSKPVDASGG